MIPFAHRGAADGIRVPFAVQSANTENDTGATTIARAYTNSVIAGNLLAIDVSHDIASAETITGVADTQGNKWKLAVGVSQATNNERSEIWYVEGAAGGPTTVTVTFSVSTPGRRLTVLEVANIAKTNALDKTASATGNSTTPDSGSVEPTSNYQYCLGALQAFNGGITPGAGWVTRQTGTNNEANLYEQILPTANALSFNATITSVPWIAAIATFRPSL